MNEVPPDEDSLEPTSSPALEEYYAAHARRVQEKLSRLPALLLAAGIDRVWAHYNGCGDEGWMEDFAYLDSAGNAFPLPEAAHSLAKDIRELFYAVLGSQCAGWEINNGSSGELIWQPRMQLWHHRHLPNPASEEDIADLSSAFADDKTFNPETLRHPQPWESTFTDSDVQKSQRP
jgi:hypothetical protein